jgi:hypothetical protein
MTYRRINESLRALAVAGVSSTLLFGGCLMEDDGADHSTETAAATFDWGADCDAGNGSFQSYIPYQQTQEIGVIPPDKKDVVVELRADADVDVQLIDEATGDQIIAWPNGTLNGPDKECTTYHGVEYCYSGYNGYDSDLDGEREQGSERIEIFGVTNRRMVMKAYGYQAGAAAVDYSWSASNTCNEKGSGTFTQDIDQNDTVDVGEIPVNKVNVFVELVSGNGADVDVQLIDATNGTEIIAWPSGLMNGPSEESIDYEGMVITYSGYNGRNGNWGHEDIRIDGRVTRPLIMRAFGYQSGLANISYEWGQGAGDACGSQLLAPCGPGLQCKNGDDGHIEVDIPGQCHTEMWCESDSSAADDCKNVIHIAVPGQWTCEEFQCNWDTGFTGGTQGIGETCGGIASLQCEAGLECKAWQVDVSDPAGVCQLPDYCEVQTAAGDCAALPHIDTIGSWGCEQNSCAWVSSHEVELVSFDSLRANPVNYADGELVQVTWEVDAAPTGQSTMVLGEAPTTPPPLGAGGDFVILNGLQCDGTECDIPRGEWVTATGRIGLLQGGHILMTVVRAELGTTCSLGQPDCGSDMHCQIGIGCPTPNNCGFNPPGMCLEN